MHSHPIGNLILIGMTGTGKTTLGQELAAQLSWAYLDTDYLLQAWWGLPLPRLLDWLKPENFLQAEEDILIQLNVNRCIISTGGSVVYRKTGMRALQKLGPIIELQADLEIIHSRVDQNPDRGLIKASGQSLEELYAERKPLYALYADRQIDTSRLSPPECARQIRAWLKEKDAEILLRK